MWSSEHQEFCQISKPGLESIMVVVVVTAAAVKVAVEAVKVEFKVVY